MNEARDNGRFELLERVGAGSSSAVYRAHDRATGGAVAFKELFGLGPDDSARFARECALLSTLTAPSVVRYVAHGLGATPWLAMEWVEGPTLAKLLKARGLTWAESVALVEKVARAVGDLHRHGIVHRDIKPSNILLEASDVGRPKLIDLGIARPEGESMTLTGVVVGTAGYMAPEQARGESHIDSRADVFALGCLLFRMLTGEAPFRGDDALAVMLRVTLEDAPRLADVDARFPAELDEACARLLARQRELRPRDGHEVAEILASLGGVESVPTRRSFTDLGAVTTTERRLAVLVLVRPVGAGPGEIEAAMSPLGIRAGPREDGTVLVSLKSDGDAGSAALRAARAALRIRAAVPRAMTAICLGRAADATGAEPAEEVADRASALLTGLGGDGRTGEIAMDAGMARLLADRFVIRPRPFGGELVAEHAGASLGAADLSGELVGRERELAFLREAIEGAWRTRRAVAVVVTGPAGAGKSRLARELLGQLRDGADAWVLQGDPLTSSTPLGMLRPLFIRQAGVVAGEPSSVSVERLRALVSTRVPPAESERVTEFLAELLALPAEGPRSISFTAARRDATLMGDQQRRAVCELVESTCRDKPLLVVVEDLEWADQATLSLLQSVLATLEASPLCLLALGRPAARTAFPRLLAHPGVRSLELDPLSREASEGMTRSLLGRAATDEVVTTIVERAGGNPFFLEELARVVRTGGSAAALPDSVLSVLEARLEALPGAARRTLRAASVFGRRFWQAGLVSLLPKVDVEAQLDQLERAELVRRTASTRFDGHAEWAFRSSALQEASYARLPSEDRKRAHLAAARWLEAAGESDPTLLAEHFDRGGDQRSAAGLLASAAHLALEASDLEQAVTLAERAARCGFEGVELGGVLADEAEARLWLGQNPEALGAAKRALSLLVPGGAAWCRAATVAVTAGGRTEDREAVTLVLESVLELDPGGASIAETNLIAQAAVQLIFLGSLESADRVLARTAAGLAHRDPGQAAWILRARAWRALAAGDAAGFGTLMRHSAIAFSEIGDQRNASVQQVNVGYASMLLGQNEEAVSALQSVLREAKPLGLTAVSAVARHNLGLALARSGKIDAGEKEEREAVDAFRAQGDLRMLAASQGYLAQILVEKGDVEGALRAAQLAVEAAPDRSPARAIALATLAVAHLARVVPRGGLRALVDPGGSVSAALAAATTARSLLGALGGVDEGEGMILTAHARALAAAGREADARVAARAALARLRERADKLGDGQRSPFLERVPENRDILELARALGLEDPDDGD